MQPFGMLRVYRSISRCRSWWWLMTPVAADVWQAVGDRAVLLVDVVLVLVLGGLHVLTTLTNDLTSIKTKNIDKAADHVRSAANAGLTVVGILIPVALLTVTIGTGSGSAILTEAALIDLTVAAMWLLLSMALGAYAIYTTGFRGFTENVLAKKDVAIALGLQIILLLVGTLRLVWGLSSLVGQLLKNGM